MSAQEQPSMIPAVADPISEAIARSGLLRPGECLLCDVCCRFPEAGSTLAPFFCHEEQAAAAEAGLQPKAFLPGRFGAGGWPLLRPCGKAYVCPAFRRESNDCAIYTRRPLDCRLYPFLLMYSADGTSVTLGLDNYCPRAAERLHEPAVAHLAGEVAALLDGPLLPELTARHGIVGEWKENVEPLRKLPAATRALCRSDLGLARLVTTARDGLEPFFAAQAGTLSYHSFPTLAAWADVFNLYWKTCGERLLVIAEAEGDTFLFCQPLGSGPVARAAEEGFAIVEALNPNGPSPRIQEADDATARELESSGWRIRESAAEYIYSRADLADLRGNRFAAKRQMCNRFEREHDWGVRAYEPEDFSSVMELYGKWLAARAQRNPEEFFLAQAEAGYRTLHRSLRDAGAIGLHGMVLEAEDRIVGYTGGYPLSDGRSFHILHEVTDLDIKGTAQVIFREFCRAAGPCERINAGGGSGLPALDRVKESYRPVERRGSHTLVRAGIRRSIRSL